MSLPFSASPHRIFLGFSFIFWLVPFFCSGWTGRSWGILPKAVSFQHTAAGLFTKRSTLWWDQHIEARGMDGRSFEVPERAVFGMGAFGFRTRFDRILIETQRSSVSRQVRWRLAEHVLARVEGDPGVTMDPSVESGRERLGPPVKSLQLIRTLWKVGSEGLANPAGEWNPPPVTEVTGPNHQVLGTYQLVNGKAVEIRTPRSLDASRTARSGAGSRTTMGSATAGSAPRVIGATVPRVINGVPQPVSSGATSAPTKRTLVVPAPAPGSPPGTVRSAVIPGRTAPVQNPTPDSGTK